MSATVFRLALVPGPAGERRRNLLAGLYARRDLKIGDRLRHDEVVPGHVLDLDGRPALILERGEIQQGSYGQYLLCKAWGLVERAVIDVSLEVDGVRYPAVG